MTDQERIDRTAALLLSAARESNELVTGDGRVHEECAAQLMGVSCSTLKNWRSAGNGPAFYRGGRTTYRLADLAAWIEGLRVDS